jgi:hypothetical protein
MDDRRAPTDLPSRDQGTFAPVAVASPGRPLVRWVVLATLALAVAVLKPWGGGAAPRPTGLVQAPPTPTSADLSSLNPNADGSATGPGSDVASRSEDADVAEMCLNTESWLVASVEDEPGGSVRIWRALDPVTGLRPDDPTVPWVFIGSQGVTALGWCAPIDGPERPSGGTTVEAWSVTGGVARPISLLRIRPVREPSSLGGLYRPAHGSTPTSTTGLWSSGRYVFRVRSGNDQVQTFGVDIEVNPLGPPGPGVTLASMNGTR